MQEWAILNTTIITAAKILVMLRNRILKKCSVWGMVVENGAHVLHIIYSSRITGILVMMEEMLKMLSSSKRRKGHLQWVARAPTCPPTLETAHPCSSGYIHKYIQ